MKPAHAETTINGPAEAVWAVLTDASKYTEWDPNMVRIEGKIASGEKLAVWTKLAPKRAFKVRVTEFTPNRRMVWTGGMPLFKGVRSFDLQPEGGTVKFTVHEKFSGLLTPLFGRMIPDMNPVFAQFAQGLKQRVEGGARR